MTHRHLYLLLIHLADLLVLQAIASGWNQDKRQR